MTDATTYHVNIPEGLEGKRLDQALVQLMAGQNLSRMRLQQLIEGGQVTLNGASVVKSKHPVQLGETYSISVPAPKAAEPTAQAIDLNIVYEDADLLVIDKPVGMVVHPAAGNPDGTLVNALLAHCAGSLSGINGVKRPGIVHRLDKETSGLMVVAKNDGAHQGLAAQFAAHEDGGRSLSRIYHAFAYGMTPGSKKIETQIGRDAKNRLKMAVVQGGGKHAVTHLSSLQHFGGLATLVACKLETGRTHQIRVHLQHIGYPIVGDPLYGKKRDFKGLPPELRNFPRQALHAAELSFQHPVTRKKLKFTSPLPADMQMLQRTLENL